MNSRMAMSLLSRSSLISNSTRHRLLGDAEQHVLEQLTRDPSMPSFIRNLIESLFQIFWADVVLELDRDSTRNERDAIKDPATNGEVPQVAVGMLKVLAVEARNLPPVNGMGTNPYIRGILGQHIRRSRTAWSTLRPAWNHLMDFPVLSLSSTLELDVMSQAPLFGGDTRLGHVSLPLQSVIGASASSHDGSSLVYRCEPLVGARSGELVLILEYKTAEQSFRGVRNWFARARAMPVQWAAQFRAFYLYHYWPCDKSTYRQYLREPVDIGLLLLLLCPFATIRAIFYTMLLLCLCAEWPPDEHQIVQFILAFKGTAIFTNGIGPLVQGLLTYYSCARLGTCATGGGPGSNIGLQHVALDMYQEILIWFVCFALLPRTLTFRARCGDDSNRRTAFDSDADDAAKRGGRMKSLLKYNLGCFVLSVVVFSVLCVRDVIALAVQKDDFWDVLTWRSAENFFWARVLFGFGMCPFVFLMHPTINKLLTHSTPTGFTRLGTLQRYSPVLDLSRSSQKLTTSTTKTGGAVASAATPDNASSFVAQSSSPKGDCSERLTASVDPVEDLCTLIRRLPFGNLAVTAGGVGVKVAGFTTATACNVISLELRAASAAVSLGMRVADNGSQLATNVACFAARCVPGADRALKTASAARGTAYSAVEATLARSASLARQLPGGEAALEHINQLSETDGLDGAALLQLSQEKAELLKLEAAAGLAELLRRAEGLAEREALEALQLVHPELAKVSQALRVQSHGFQERIQRVRCACSTMRRSMLAWSQDIYARLPVVVETFQSAALREYADLKAQKDHRAPGWFPLVEAYSRLVCSAMCEGLLELRLPRLEYFDSSNTGDGLEPDGASALGANEGSPTACDQEETNLKRPATPQASAHDESPAASPE